MDIEKLWVSQNNLRRAHQIPAMIETLRTGYPPPVLLARCEDNEIQVEDGHHRLLAIYLTGRLQLDISEFLLVEKDQWKPRRGRIHVLVSSYNSRINECDL